MFNASTKQLIRDCLANAKYGTKANVAQQLSDKYSVSVASIYRVADFKKTARKRQPQKPEYREWVPKIVALAQSQPKPVPLDLALEAAVMQGIVPLEAKTMPVATIARIARELGLHCNRKSRTHRMHADYPLQAIQIDGSTSEFFVVDSELPNGDFMLKTYRKPTPSSGYKNKPLGPDRLRLQVYGIWDMFSGYTISRYVVAKGETSLDAMDFLCYALEPKQDKRIVFEGVPDDLWSDQGALFKSHAARDLLARLGINIVTGKPYNKERQGGVERANRTRWSRFERPMLLRADQYITLSDLNARLAEFEIKENAAKVGREKIDDTLYSRTTSFRYGIAKRQNPPKQMPLNAMATMALEAKRKVDRNGIFSWKSIEYELKNLHDCWIIARVQATNAATGTIVVEDIKSGELHEARPYQTRKYGEIIGTKKTAAEHNSELHKDITAQTNADIYAPNRAKKPQVLPMPVHTKKAEQLQSNLTISDCYANIDEALDAFYNIYNKPLSSTHSKNLIDFLHRNSFNRKAVRELAQNLLISTGT